jgi:hypothetical protein
VKTIHSAIGIVLLTILSLCRVGFTEPFAVNFKPLSFPVSCSFFGTPLQVVKVEHTGKTFFNKETEKYTYGFKATVLRPGNDDGRGVVYDAGVGYRIYYWAAEDRFSPAIAIRNGMEVYQDTDNANPRFITLYITTGLHPGIHRIRIAAFPYPMYSETGSIREAIQVYRSDTASFLENWVKVTSVPGLIYGLVKDKGQDALIDSLFLKVSTWFGQIIEFEVPAVMPNIKTRYAQDAINVLKAQSLVPAPDYGNFIPTNDARYDKRVARVQYEFGQKLHAGSTVAYKFFKFVSSSPPDVKTQGRREICGDGIDNNGNNQIDEGCYEWEIIIDDNECRDDTIGLAIDGTGYGSTPAGNKRHFNINQLSRGKHTLEIIGLHSGGKAYKCNDDDVISYSVKMGRGMQFSDGKTYVTGKIKAGERKQYTISIP